jgi:hypothetical protein
MGQSSNRTFTRRQLVVGVGGVSAPTILVSSHSDSLAATQPSSVQSITEKIMSTSDELAQATVRIALENSSGLGSGFHFIKPNIIVSNAHVAAPLITTNTPMFAHGEIGQRWSLSLLASSPPEEFDYAIMTTTGENFDSRRALTPDAPPITTRGRKILYAGYPHGIDPLLVIGSEITAPVQGNSFCFAGMVHGGNSGGPIVDTESLAAIGVVTKRRFLGDPEMQKIDNEMKQLQLYLQGIQGQGSIQLMGVNFGQFALEMSKIVSVTNNLIRLNSTTGIGIGYPIQALTDRCKELGLF